MLVAKQTVEEILAMPSAEFVEDLSAMSWLFYGTCTHLLRQPTILAPHFSGGPGLPTGTGDLIAGGCLIEVKASIKPEIHPEWWRQLARYLSQDSNDCYEIRSVGIYMARQGMLFTWPVEEFIWTLTGDPSVSLEELRREYEMVCDGWVAFVEKKRR